jgi:hypothetical protein
LFFFFFCGSAVKFTSKPEIVVGNVNWTHKKKKKTTNESKTEKIY